MNIFLFTTPFCVFCPQAKKLLAGKKDVAIIDASTSEGLELAKTYHIMKVPSVLVINDAGLVEARYEGIDRIVSYCASLSHADHWVSENVAVGLSG